jgi:hypothetical protein
VKRISFVTILVLFLTLFLSSCGPPPETGEISLKFPLFQTRVSPPSTTQQTLLFCADLHLFSFETIKRRFSALRATTALLTVLVLVNCRHYQPMQQHQFAEPRCVHAAEATKLSGEIVSPRSPLNGFLQP